MSTTGFEAIDHTVQLTHRWVNELDAMVGWGNKPRAYRLIRTVLQAVRDWLQVNYAAHLGAQLPLLLRGVYYEDRRPAATRSRSATKRVSSPGLTTPSSHRPDERHLGGGHGDIPSALRQNQRRRD